ncbi:MAG: M20 family metallopeptidase [Opitutaceae bacterium]
MSRFPSSVVSVLSELVARPSVSPEADSAGTRQGEAALAALLVERLRALGADVGTALLAPGRPNVIAVFEPRGRAKATVLFAPHLDTVGAAGMIVPPFRLTSRGGRLYARGACDTKGPTAALLWAFRKWTRSPGMRAAGVRWVIAATAGEEDGSLGAQSLVKAGRVAPAVHGSGGAESRRCLAVDFAVALEPTDLRVVRAGKGVFRIWIETRGRAAHGSRPERGVNAIYRMLPLAGALEREVVPALAARRHPVLGSATLNVGIISGGRGVNVVPDTCTIGVDVRVHPNCTSATVKRLLAEVCRREAPEAKIRVQCDLPSFVAPRGDPWAQRLRRHAGRGWATAPWFCDANIFGEAGIPSVAFGPGSMAQAHTRDEYIRRAELEAGATAFLRFLTHGRK